MTTYRVSIGLLGKPVTVRAESRERAALLGATKLGMRWFGRRPAGLLFNRPGRDFDPQKFTILGPHDRKSGGQHVIGSVWVTPALAKTKIS